MIINVMIITIQMLPHDNQSLILLFMDKCIEAGPLVITLTSK